MKVVKLLSGTFHRGDETLSDGAMEKPALLVYAGKFDSMEGEVPITDEHIELIAANHNKALEQIKLSGRDLEMKDFPPVQVDHSVSGWDTVGRLIGPVTVGEHEGKKALYGKVKVLGKDNVDRVRDGRWTHLSIGADLENGKLSELTITPFPAAPNAALLAAQGSRGEIAKKMDVSGRKVEIFRRATANGNELALYIDGKEVEGAFDSLDNAVAKAQAIISADGKSSLSKGGLSMDHEKMKKHLAAFAKCTDEEAEKKLSKMTEDKKAEYWKKMSAGDEEGNKHLAAEEEAEKKNLAGSVDGVPKNTVETKPKDDLHPQLTAKTNFIKLAKGFKKDSAKLVNDGSKIQLSAKLSALRAKNKIAPVELKAIDLDKLSKLSQEAQDAVLQSYENRLPIVMIGQYGSAKATDITTVVEKAKKDNMVKEMAQDMHFSKKMVSRLSSSGGNAMPTSMDTQTQMESMPTSMEDHIQLGEEHLKHMRHLMESGNYDEAQEHLKKMEAHHENLKKLCHMSEGEGKAAPSGQNPDNHVPGDELKHMSALVESHKKLQNDFKDLIKLAGPALGIDEADLNTEE